MAAAAMAGMGFSIPTLDAAQMVDDFNDGDDVGWTHYDPIGAVVGQAQATWTFPSGAYRLQSIASPNLALLGPSRVGAQSSDVSAANFQLAIDLTGWNDNLTQAMGLVARTQTPGPGTTKGYVFGYASGAGKYAQIVRVNNERSSNIAGSAPVAINLNPAQDYRLTFQGQGSRLEGRIYALPNTTDPIVTLIADDSSFAEGTMGILAFSVNALAPEPVDATFDNFWSVDAVSPTLEHRDLGFGLFQLLWPGDAGAFRLESSEALPAATWVPVDEFLVTYSADIDRYIYQFDASVGQQFFRLRLP